MRLLDCVYIFFKRIIHPELLVVKKKEEERIFFLTMKKKKSLFFFLTSPSKDVSCISKLVNLCTYD